MRRTNFPALLAIGILAALAVISQADALQTTKAFKEEVLTIKVTPSPSPLAFHWPAAPANAAPAKAVAVSPRIARLAADPYAGPVRVASIGTLWDVAPRGVVIAQATSAQASPVPVQFVAKADPNANFLRIIPHLSELDVPYGTTVFPCVFEIYTYYTTAYQLSDWAYGTTSSGGGGSYPMMNYPTTSYLSWAVPDFAATYHTYANSGSPGEKVWSGLAGQAQQHCVNLQVVVPNTQPPGIYTATAQYTLIVN